MSVQNKAVEDKFATLPQVVSLLMEGSGEREAKHLSSTRRRHTTSAGQKSVLQDSYRPQLRDRNKRTTMGLAPFPTFKIQTVIHLKNKMWTK